MLDAFYEDGYVLVRIRDIASETTDENGNTVFSWREILLPEDKKPLVMSQDDVCYYPYMEKDALHAGSSSERTENPLLKWSWKTAPFPLAL